VRLRVRFVAAAPGQPSAASDTTVAEQAATLQIGEPASVSALWTAVPGSRVLAARIEVLPDQRIRASDVAVVGEPASGLALAVDDVAPARPGSASDVVVRPAGTAGVGGTIREPSEDARTARDRRIATPPLGFVAARDGALPAGAGLVLDVPLYVANASAVDAVELRCNVFASSFGDLVGSGQVTRPVSGGAFAEIVAVPIAWRPGRSSAAAARYSCIAALVPGANPTERAAMPGGVAGTAERRAATERQLGRTFLIFSDLAQGEIDGR
jgi:hypothetical protein